MTKKSLEFHIQVNDYFGTLATVLDLLRQNASRGYKREHDRLLLQLRNDLVFLQHRFRIVRAGAQVKPGASRCAPYDAKYRASRHRLSVNSRSLEEDR